MLSSAHVLAMDAKNLLDVVDSIRVRYPRVTTTRGEADGGEDTSGTKLDIFHPVLGNSSGCAFRPSSRIRH